MNMISNNIFCQFLISDGEYLQCVNCGLKIKTSNNSPILFPCSRSLHRSENENSPSFIKKIKNFIADGF